MKKCEANITLRGATGSQRQQFVGEIGVNMQILCAKYKFCQPVYHKFFVSTSIKQNILGSDLISCVEGNISYKKQSFSFVNDNGLNHAMLFPRVNKLVLRNLEDVEVGTNLTRFGCDTPIMSETWVMIPKYWFGMIGTSQLVLQPD